MIVKQNFDDNSSIDVGKSCKKCNHFPTVVLGHDLKELSDSEFITNEYFEDRINFVLDNLNHETLKLQINKKK